MPEENQAETLSTTMTGATRSAETARALIRKTKRATRRRFPTEDKIRIVIEGVRGEISVAELCRREGIHPTIYYKWLKDFMEAGKARMRGDTVREATSDEVKALRRENERLKQLVADLSVANLLLKKKPELGLNGRRRYERVSADKKRELIELVRRSPQPKRMTIAELGLSHSTFYRWQRRYRDQGQAGLADRKPNPRTVWNRLRPAEKTAIVETALQQPDLSPRELACHLTDHAGFTVSEATVYRVLKRYGLNRSITLVGFPASKEFRVKTTAPNQMWQSDASYYFVVVTTDVRVLKYFPFAGAKRLDVVAELFNLFNSVNVSQINPVFGSNLTPMAGFRQPIAGTGARQGQFSLDFEF